MQVYLNQQLTVGGSSSTKATGQPSNLPHWRNGNLYVTIRLMSYQIKELLLDFNEASFPRNQLCNHELE